MKLSILIGALFLSCTAMAQSTFTKPDAKQIIITFFEGFHEGDSLKMQSVAIEGVVMQTAMTSRSGEDIVETGSFESFKTTIANRPDTQKWEEKILDYKIQIDGNLAHVWTPYEFYFNGNFSHCGANAFTLARFDDGWKIIHLIDSRRFEGCDAQKK